MVNPALGTKRMCLTCERPFYDLGRSPIVCPGCGNTLVVEAPRKVVRMPRARVVRRPVPATPEPEAEETTAGSDVPMLDADQDEEEAERPAQEVEDR